jgi:hypothetical protein
VTNCGRDTLFNDTGSYGLGGTAYAYSFIALARMSGKSMYAIISIPSPIVGMPRAHYGERTYMGRDRSRSRRSRSGALSLTMISLVPGG